VLSYPSMGFFDRLRGQKIEAQAAPQLMTDAFNYYLPIALTAVGREEAMSVPSVARCRNLLAGTIASFPLELYKKSTGEKLGKPIWVEQPSAHQPRSTTIAWTVDSLLFYGVAYWQVTELYADDGRPSRFQWIAPGRVSFDSDPISQYITQYYVDGKAVPMSGLLSLITFTGLDEGVLQRGARTLRSAIDLETAARVATATPMPSGVLKNNGADLSQEEVQAILAAWKSAREKRSTAYLTSTLEYQPTAFSPRDMMFVDAIQQMSTQVARMMNVPAYYISADQNTSMTYANVQDERRQFVSLSLAPYVHAIQDRLSMDDVSARGNIIKFDVENAFLAVDSLERLAVIEKMLALGLITVEDAMEMENLSPNGRNDAPNVL
jgi:HK97 family phage portal protein